MKSALLTRTDLKICRRIAEQEGEHGERAIMLLALHGGALQVQAAVESGLTPGQVRYWVAKFRRDGLGIFPDGLRASPAPDPQPAEAPATDAEEQPKEKKRKSDKKKSGKKSDGKKKKKQKKGGKKKSKKDKKSGSKKKRKGDKKGKKNKSGKKKRKK